MPDTFTAEQRDRIARRAERRCSDFEDVALPPLPAVPGQISDAEGRYLYGLLSQGYAGVGGVVEVGCWLGSSTAHLAAGLRDSGRPGVLHTFDRFRWGGQGDNAKSGLNLEPGCDFQPYMERYIAPLREWVEVHRATFEEISWGDEPIEILFLDGPKTAQQLSSVLKTLGPGLIPGVSLVVFQDYQHPVSYEVPLAVYRLRHKLEMRHAVQAGGTVAFLASDRLDAREVALDRLTFRKSRKDEAVAAWEAIREPLEGQARHRLTSAMALHLCDIGETAAAFDALRSVYFDDRLHAGWQSWQRIARMAERYRPLFEVYNAEIRPPSG